MKVTSDGSTASYYELPEGARELQDLISHRDMNAQMGEIFRACYRYGQASHSDKLRDAKKIRFYIEAEIARLQLLEKSKPAQEKSEFPNKPSWDDAPDWAKFVVFDGNKWQYRSFLPSTGNGPVLHCEARPSKEA